MKTYDKEEPELFSSFNIKLILPCASKASAILPFYTIFVFLLLRTDAIKDLFNIPEVMHDRGKLHVS